ncbi:MAG: DUF2027 domain-containing protein [Bacteroidales bacterium]|nr:DUF2027 domain-containing protein [Bacteroidales bacterium]MDE6802296.1 DUF2027 domain-containing protein [Muribaculaceae bacterium]
MAKIGDIVRFLNSTGGGRIVRIEGNIAHVEDSDGFEVPILLKECVVVDQASSRPQSTAPAVAKSPAIKPSAPAPKAVAADEDDDVESGPETDTGNTLNLVLGYEPTDLKHLSTSDFDAYIVNDSNYYLYFTYMTRSDSDDGWNTRYAGIVEPNIQLRIDTVTQAMLPAMDRIAFQYIAFKQERQYAAKNPALVEYNLDTTRFFKLHAFHDNPYFDIPVIAFDLVRNDRPMRQKNVDGRELEKAMRQKRNADRRPVIKRQFKHGDKRNGDIIEVDLHINELVDNTAGLTAADMLNLQVDEFRRVMDQNLKNKGQKIVFIHGKGEGVLRNALTKELTHRYKGHLVQDASFQEYGYGATQVTIV